MKKRDRNHQFSSEKASRKLLLLRQGLRLEAVTIIWMAIMATLTVFEGVEVNSALLLAVGAGSAIDMLSASALFWHLRQGQKGLCDQQDGIAEQRIARLVGYLLALTAIYTVGISGYKLMNQQAADSSYLAILIAVVSALLLPIIAKKKISLSNCLKSPSLHADGVGTLVCGLMAVVLILGQLGLLAFNYWWVDAAGALLLVPMLLFEAKNAFASAKEIIEA